MSWTACYNGGSTAKVTFDGAVAGHQYILTAANAIDFVDATGTDICVDLTDIGGEDWPVGRLFWVSLDDWGVGGGAGFGQTIMQATCRIGTAGNIVQDGGVAGVGAVVYTGGVAEVTVTPPSAHTWTFHAYEENVGGAVHSAPSDTTGSTQTLAVDLSGVAAGTIVGLSLEGYFAAETPTGTIYLGLVEVGTDGVMQTAAGALATSDCLCAAGSGDGTGYDDPTGPHASGFRWIAGQVQNDTVLRTVDLSAWKTAGFYTGVWGVTYNQANFVRDATNLGNQAVAHAADFVIVDAEFCLFYADDDLVQGYIDTLGAIFSGPKALAPLGAASNGYVYPINYSLWTNAGYKILPQAYYSTGTADGQSPDYRPDLVMAHAARAGIDLSIVYPMINVCSPGHPTADEWVDLLTAASRRSAFSVFMTECTDQGVLDILGDTSAPTGAFTFNSPGLISDTGGGIPPMPGGPGPPSGGVPPGGCGLCDPLSPCGPDNPCTNPGFPPGGDGPLPGPGDPGYAPYHPPDGGSPTDPAVAYPVPPGEIIIPPGGGDPDDPTVDVLPNLHFFEAPYARFVVTNLNGEIVTFLDVRSIHAEATHTLNAPFELVIDVPSDTPEVNLHAAVLDPDQPFIDEGLNLVYWFLRWGKGGSGGLSSSPGPWQCHGAGIILETSDKGGADSPVTTLTAYDPWKLLYRAPVLDEDGNIVDPIAFRGSTRASDIVKTLIERAQNPGTYSGFDAHVLINDSWIEETEPLPPNDEGVAIEFQSGTSVGEALDQLVETGTIDIYFKPLWDPVNHPGVLAELHIFSRMGVFRPQAVFSWDRWPRSVVELERQQDGTERVNYIQYYAGLDQIPAVPRHDDDSIARYGLYFEQQSWPASASELQVEKIADREIRLRSHGKFDYTMDVAGERSPKPFKEYNLGDTVPVWASKRLRRTIENKPLRIQKIPMVLDNEQLMRVGSLELSDDVEAT